MMYDKNQIQSVVKVLEKIKLIIGQAMSVKILKMNFQNTLVINILLQYQWKCCIRTRIKGLEFK